MRVCARVCAYANKEGVSCGGFKLTPYLRVSYIRVQFFSFLPCGTIRFWFLHVGDVVTYRASDQALKVNHRLSLK